MITQERQTKWEAEREKEIERNEAKEGEMNRESHTKNG